MSTDSEDYVASIRAAWLGEQRGRHFSSSTWAEVTEDGAASFAERPAVAVQGMRT